MGEAWGFVSLEQCIAGIVGGVGGCWVWAGAGEPTHTAEYTG